MALAHPGHDHSDIPSVIRHPFASLDHIVITGVVLGAIGAAALLAGWLVRPGRAAWRWAGAGLMAAAVALMLI